MRNVRPRGLQIDAVNERGRTSQGCCAALWSIGGRDRLPCRFPDVRLGGSYAWTVMKVTMNKRPSGSTIALMSSFVFRFPARYVRGSFCSWRASRRSSEHALRSIDLAMEHRAQPPWRRASNVGGLQRPRDCGRHRRWVSQFADRARATRNIGTGSGARFGRNVVDAYEGLCALCGIDSGPSRVRTFLPLKHRILQANSGTGWRSALTTIPHSIGTSSG